MLKNNSEHFLSPRAASEVQHMPPADDPSKKMCSSIFGWNSPEALLSTECDGVSKLLCKKRAAQSHTTLAAMNLSVFQMGAPGAYTVRIVCQRAASRHQECFRYS